MVYVSNAEQHYAFKELDKQRVVSFEIKAELYNQLYSRYTTLKCPLYLFFLFFIYLSECRNALNGYHLQNRADCDSLPKKK